MARKPSTDATALPPPAENDAAGTQRSRERIYEAMARTGSAFGAPFAQGVASLTQRVVEKFKQRGFFGFETFERTPSAQSPDEARPNKFSRYGAGRYFGPYRKPPR